MEILCVCFPYVYSISLCELYFTRKMALKETKQRCGKHTKNANSNKINMAILKMEMRN